VCTRWEGSLENLHKDIENSVGDCVIAGMYIYAKTYFRSETGEYISDHAIEIVLRSSLTHALLR